MASWESQVIHDPDSSLFAGKLVTSEYDSFQVYFWLSEVH